MRLTRPRLLSTLGAGALAVPLLALTGPATAAEPTCQGRTATITSDAGVVRGTEGPDVISVGPATYQVDALGGDDVICFHAARVDAGAGNDALLSLEGSAGPSAVASVTLGPGDDTYTGSSRPDQVSAFEDLDAPRANGVDVISTGGGADSVSSSAGPGEVNRDRIDLGDGDDRVRLVLPRGSSAALDAGTGYDEVGVGGPDAGGDWSIDLRAATVNRDGTQLSTLAGAESVTASLDARVLALVGTDGDDVMTAFGGPRRLLVDTGAGDDRLTVAGLQGRARGTVDLGAGRDTAILADRQVVQLDLDRGRLQTRGGGRVTVRGVEDGGGVAPRVVVRGDAGANALYGAGCRVEVRGGAGPDQLYGGGPLGSLADFTCAGTPRNGDRARSDIPRGGALLVGGPGNDVMRTGNRPDVLLGGPGRDTADARGGRDRCEAERKTSCER